VYTSRTPEEGAHSPSCPNGLLIDFFLHLLLLAGQVVAAKVPIIKCVERLTGIQVDVSMGTTNGLAALQLAGHLRQAFPPMPSLTLLLKSFLLMKDMNGVSRE
jgi:DNA polymerase sigma